MSTAEEPGRGAQERLTAEVVTVLLPLLLGRRGIPCGLSRFVEGYRME